jgi:two-component system response regulator
MEDKLLLLVEDNPSDEELTLRTLKKHHVANRVVSVHDGAEALDFLFCRGAHAGRNPEDRPQAVLLDLNLPKVDGVEVLRQMRAHESTRYVPVVVLTSSDEERDMVRSYGAGANSFVRKPVEFSAFAEAVRDVGLYWLLLNRPPPPASPE